MKIINTAIILGLTLLAVPIFTWFSGVALGEEEWAVLRTLVYVLAGVVLFTFLVGELTSNNSQVDKLWSIIPIVYVWIIAHYGDYAPRLMVMLVLVALWGGRLTTNFALKGAYSWKFWDGEEDYRWVVLRNKPEFQPRWKWTLFNLFFISGYQNVLILLFTLPALVVFQFRDAPLGVADYAVAGAMFFFIAFETLADWQQWTFQSAKWAKIKSGQPLNPDEQAGFCRKAFGRGPDTPIILLNKPFGFVFISLPSAVARTGLTGASWDVYCCFCFFRAAPILVKRLVPRNILPTKTIRPGCPGLFPACSDATVPAF